ncbi:MAG: AI-2E family transporter [Clostridium sp.]|uniref:AI-2E family transporter n=1 Tax=Butyribacter sp. TaxID=2822465 RepID=UPI002A9940C4|nr:AI-2E family transporter [Clostridium sp.]MDY5181629.1 AI-2E family transporter [Butyribacter sp.]
MAQNEKDENERITIKEVFGKWFGLFLVLISAAVVYLLIINLDDIFSGFMFMLSVLKPVIYGAIIAYLLNPLTKMYYRLLLKGYEKKGKSPSDKTVRIMESMTIVFALLTGVLIIAILCWLVIPQLITTVISLIETVPSQANDYYNYITDKIQSNKYIASRMQDTALQATKYMDNIMNNDLFPWLKSELLPNLNIYAKQFANGVMSFINVLYNLFIGIIVAIYLLKGKRVFAAQAKKITYGVCRKKTADTIIHYVRISNNMFSGFISGKIVDSTIIGIICFVLMTIFRMPYALLVSVIVGVTNVIPVFGPYIGAIPSALLILLVSPVQALYFIILVAILQQVDGNIIGPAILGESTGLSAFWVLFSILFFGGFWGIVGMLVGCPLFAVIYTIAKDFINYCLEKRKLSTDTQTYVNLKTIEDGRDGYEYIEYTVSEINGKRNKKNSASKAKSSSLMSVLKKFLKKVMDSKQISKDKNDEK